MKRISLTQHLIEEQRLHNSIPAELRLLIEVVARACKTISHSVGKGALGDVLGSASSENVQGEIQKKLDIISNEILLQANEWGGHLAAMASEEMETIHPIPNRYPKGEYMLLFDPLDGSSNIDCNVSIGTIFSVLPAEATAAASFLRPMSAQIAGGYIIFGPQVALVVTWGDGVAIFVMDPDTGVFTHVPGEIAIPPATKEYAINASNRRHWTTPVHSYIQSCEAGDAGPRAKNYNMRWVASLVAETHRILSRGGVFLYPGDARKGYEQGRLRMLYECAPIAFLIEQAGGQATNGHARVLDQSVDRLHMRTPFVFGAVEEVAEVKRLWG